MCASLWWVRASQIRRLSSSGEVRASGGMALIQSPARGIASMAARNCGLPLAAEGIGGLFAAAQRWCATALHCRLLFALPGWSIEPCAM